MKLILLMLVPFLALTSCGDDDEPTTATIRGTITVQNADLWEIWQDSGEVQLSIFPQFEIALPPAAPSGKGWGDVPNEYFGPGVPGGRFALSAPTESITIQLVPGQSTYPYSLTVQPGTYSALALGFRHDFISNPSTRTATLGVHWDNPTDVSYGLVINVPAGPGQFISIINEPAPSVITVAAGDELDIDFTADLGFVNVWPFR